MYQTLNYTFKDADRLRTAMTHRSYAATHNERLEYLGDSILNFIIAEQLYHRFPAASEGELSRLRASLVKGETLAELAQAMKLGDYLLLGEGEIKSGGRDRPSILADVFEAVIGAIYLDSDFIQIKTLVTQWFADRMAGLSLEVSEKDAKSQLQEWLQSKKLPLPKYDVVAIEGESHCQIFTVSCLVHLHSEPTTAKAANRKNAEKLAAQLMLNKLGVVE